ncbi:hypothetical protein [Budvicia aquatica]|uniref:hypothetical protein n=1 Tax=Budvicia aquatica TaxID=82979 RepID=UPI00208775CB|nr:hypothetical protein [Budvicia aquatica]GKX53838.1 hypothetical protein SOASR029_41470 [Budvicia aquatica]
MQLTGQLVDPCFNVTISNSGSRSQFCAFHHQGGQVCRIDHNGNVLTEHHWQEGREERRILGGDLTSRNLFDSRGRLISQQVKVRDNESHHIRRDYE